MLPFFSGIVCDQHIQQESSAIVIKERPLRVQSNKSDICTARCDLFQILRKMKIYSGIKNPAQNVMVWDKLKIMFVLHFIPVV